MRPLPTPSEYKSAVRTSNPGTPFATFLNGAFVHQEAGYFASRLASEAAPSAKDQVERAFALALGRPPRADESRAALEFLDKQERQIQADAYVKETKAVDVRHRSGRRSFAEIEHQPLAGRLKEEAGRALGADAGDQVQQSGFWAHRIRPIFQCSMGGGES